MNRNVTVPDGNSTTRPPFACTDAQVNQANRTTVSYRSHAETALGGEPLTGAAANRAPAFGPAVTPPDDGSPVDRLIALTGRDPGWTP